MKMNTKLQLLIAGMLLATIGTGLGQQPNITTQPQSCINAVGSTATFTVEATGTEPLAYQWQKYGAEFTDIADCTNAAMVLTNVQTSHTGDYRVVVTNVVGAVTSAVAQLNVILPPRITVQPTNWASVSLGASVTNRTQAVGFPPLSYQWCLNGAPVPGQTNTLIILTNLQSSDAGDYTAVVTNIGGSVTSRVVTLTVDATFTKITTGVIVTDAEGSLSGNLADYDNDGYPDLFVANFSSGTTRNTLYHNNGGTNFSRVSASPFTTDYMRAWSAAWADYNNDGNVDLIVANLDGGTLAQRLYRNNGDGTFTAVVDSALRSDTTRATCPWWIDYDNDGFLDLFMTKGMYLGGVANDCLFRNIGDGTFKKMTVAQVGPILNDQRESSYCTSADYDNDGSQELTVWYEPGGGFLDSTNFTWHWQADGTFVTMPIGIPGFRSWGDYDNDGWLDAFCWGVGNEPKLFSNLGTGGFTNVTAALNVTMPVVVCLATWGDYDNDGWLDLFYAGGFWLPTNTCYGLF